MGPLHYPGLSSSLPHLFTPHTSVFILTNFSTSQHTVLCICLLGERIHLAGVTAVFGRHGLKTRMWHVDEALSPPPPIVTLMPRRISAAEEQPLHRTSYCTSLEPSRRPRADLSCFTTLLLPCSLLPLALTFLGLLQDSLYRLESYRCM